MTKEQLVAQALACWITSPENGERDLLRQALPDMDIRRLFDVLRDRQKFPPGSVSMAIAGFGYSAVDLEQIRASCGLMILRGLTDDLHVAAAWRNDRDGHPKIISLAKGWHPGVSTLDHFGQAASRDLCGYLLDWAEKESGLPVNDLQRELIRALGTDDVVPLLSLDSVCSFLECWFLLKTGDSLNAPRQALVHLGIFPDPALFSKAGAVKDRLLENFRIASQVKDAAATALRAAERRIDKKFG